MTIDSIEDILARADMAKEAREIATAELAYLKVTKKADLVMVWSEGRARGQWGAYELADGTFVRVRLE